MINLKAEQLFTEAHERYLNDPEFHAQVSTIELAAKVTLESKKYNLSDRDRAFIRMGAIFALFFVENGESEDDG